MIIASLGLARPTKALLVPTRHLDRIRYARPPASTVVVPTYPIIRSAPPPHIGVDLMGTNRPRDASSKGCIAPRTHLSKDASSEGCIIQGTNDPKECTGTVHMGDASSRNQMCRGAQIHFDAAGSSSQLFASENLLARLIYRRRFQEPIDSAHLSLNVFGRLFL